MKTRNNSTNACVWITVQGHDIILISNHQTEADPAVIALLLETTNPHLAEKMVN